MILSALPPSFADPVLHSSANAARLSQVVAALFPVGTAAAELRGIGDPSLLLPREAHQVRNATPRRSEEFAAGRSCARLALGHLDITGFALIARSDRAPQWPDQVVGSITHTSGLCAAVVAPLANLRGIGVDAEVVGDVTEDLWHEVFTRAELARLGGLATSERAAAAALVFSAKEAFFKCQYGITSEWVEFRDVKIDYGQGGFAVCAQKHLALDHHITQPWKGRYCFNRGLVIAGVAMALESPSPVRSASPGW